MAKVFVLQDPSVEKAASWPLGRIVASGTTASIAGGTPTKESTSGAVAIMVDADGTTSQKFSGIAKDTSTETASVAGRVNVWMPFPGILYSGFAKSAAAADTQGEIDALMGKRVVFDLTTGDWTVDTAAGNATTNGVIIVGGEFQTSRIIFMISPQVTSFDNPTTA